LHGLDVFLVISIFIYFVMDNRIVIFSNTRLIIRLYRWWFSSERPITPRVYQRGCQFVVTCVRVEKRLQLLGQRIATYTARGAVHHWPHAKATGRPRSDQRLEIRSDGSGQVLFDSVHFFHISCHCCRNVFSASHNCWVTQTLCSLLGCRYGSHDFVKYLFQRVWVVVLKYNIKRFFCKTIKKIDEELSKKKILWYTTHLQGVKKDHGPRISPSK